MEETDTTMTDKGQTPEWILYQVGGEEPNKYRFVVTDGFRDDDVESQLRDGEFIDTTTTLSGALGGDVTVLASDPRVPELAAACKAALTHLNFSTTARPELKQQLRAAIAKAEERTR